ncbi:MAG: hypothetical protein HQL98_02860 [Magnetococcales bacterium]|nr:hypothetical protein [Magnetococcales bacterium]
MNQFRLISFVSLVFWALFAPVSVMAAAASVPDGVVYRQGKLSVAFRSTPIRVALEQVANKVGIPFLLDPEVKGTLSMSFDGVPLESALKRLLSGQSHVVVYAAGKKGEKGSTEKGDSKVVQVKVFKKGSLSATRYERVGPAEATETAADKTGEAGKAPPVTAASPEKTGTTPASRTEIVKDPAGADPSNTRIPNHINTQSVRGPAQLMAAIAETEASISLIQRKAAGESQALEAEKARTQMQLASGQGNSRELVEKLATLEQQQARSEQNFQGMMAPEQLKLQQLRQDLASLKTPAEQQIENRAMVNRQAALVRDQSTQVEAARRAEASRQAAIVAEQKAAAARNAEAKRQAEIKRQREAAQGTQP